MPRNNYQSRFWSDPNSDMACSIYFVFPEVKLLLTVWPPLHQLILVNGYLVGS